MSEMFADCPRCKTKQISFSVSTLNSLPREYDWQSRYEAFGVCRACRKSTVFVIEQRGIEGGSTDPKDVLRITDALNRYYKVLRYISIADNAADKPPEHLPDNLSAAFTEGARCRAIDCYNAAAAMFRLCVDIATRELLPREPTAGLKYKVRRELGLRVQWLFENGKLPKGLYDLSTCIREDGNDGAHAGTLGKAEADDLQDFTFALMERLYTEPQKVELAMERMRARRGGDAK